MHYAIPVELNVLEKIYNIKKIKARKKRKENWK